MLRADGPRVLEELSGWIRGGTWLEVRAAAAAVAEPADRATVEFRALRQTLGYSISVIATARPEEGLGLLRTLIDSGDADARWIARENLKKHRLIRSHPRETATLQRRLARGLGRS